MPLLDWLNKPASLLSEVQDGVTNTRRSTLDTQSAHQSGGLFLLALAKDAQGKNIYQQLNQLFD